MVQPTRTLTLPSLRDLGLLDAQPAPDPTASSASSTLGRPPPAHDPGPPSRDPLQYSTPLLKALRASHHPNVPVPAPRNGQLASTSLPSPYSRIEAYVGPRLPREPLVHESRTHPYRRLASLPSVPPEFAFPTSTTKRRCASLPEDRRGSLPPESVRREMYFPTSGQRSTIGAVAGGAGTNGGRRAVEEESRVVGQRAASSHTPAMTQRPPQHVEHAGPNSDDALLVPWLPLATASNPAPAPTHIRLPLDLLHSTLLSLTSKGGKGRPGEDQAVEELLRAVERRMERSRGGRTDSSRRGSAAIEHHPSSLRLFFPPTPTNPVVPSMTMTPSSAERPGVGQPRAHPSQLSPLRLPVPRATYGAPATPPSPSPLASFAGPSRRPSLVVQMDVDGANDGMGEAGQAMRGVTAGYTLAPGPASVQSRVR
ncbi:hypothetical protein OF846_003162 [Rhodotorula toruloides]|nr:hypothetical protein OF846_003162 [Rhodotorula toruloides]